MTSTPTPKDAAPEIDGRAALLTLYRDHVREPNRRALRKTRTPPQGAAMRAFAIGLALLAALLVSPGGAHAQELRKLPLVDEAAGDASWQSFKKRLLVAIEKRDRTFVLSILDRNVRNQDVRTRGIPTFRKQWELDTADSPLWTELAAALQLGGAYMTRDKGQKEFCAPYLLAKWPFDLEPTDYGVIVAREALVQAEPSTSSASLGALSYDIVPVTDWEVDDKTRGAKQKWVRIRLGGRDGFVPEELIRSPIEHAACFVRGPNGWRMTAFAPAGGE